MERKKRWGVGEKREREIERDGERGRDTENGRNNIDEMNEWRVREGTHYRRWRIGEKMTNV